MVRKSENAGKYKGSKMNAENIFLILLMFISSALALECYSCSNQDGNKDKCIKTTKQCEQNQDACTSYIRWAIPPYWTPRGNRIYFLSKDCDTQVNCAKRQAALKQSCVRDWYLDWACIDCCSGDMCNYYATLGSQRISISTWTTLLVSSVAVVVIWFL